jgi:hypothetical protein
VGAWLEHVVCTTVFRRLMLYVSLHFDGLHGLTGHCDSLVGVVKALFTRASGLDPAELETMMGTPVSLAAHLKLSPKPESGQLAPHLTFLASARTSTL